MCDAERLAATARDSSCRPPAGVECPETNARFHGQSLPGLLADTMGSEREGPETYACRGENCVADGGGDGDNGSLTGPD